MDKTDNKKKVPFYKKLIGFGIMFGVAVYCIPELREEIMAWVNIAKNEWRKAK